MKFNVALVAATLLFALQGGAQEMEAVLLPLAPDRVQGAFGSEWETSLVIANMSATPIRVSRTVHCFPTCEPPLLASKNTVWVPDLLAREFVTGQLAFVERGRVKDVAMTLRTRDLSRQSETWGTGIPVVSRDKMFARTFGLVDIPMEPGFRASLRIYDANPLTPPRLRVRIYGVSLLPDPPANAPPEELLQEYDVQFAMPPQVLLDEFPASADIALWLDTELQRHRRIRVELEPLDGEQDYWAFASITHNTTQHVTIVTPL